MLEKDHNAIWQYARDEAQQKLQQKKYEDLLLERLLDINPEGELLREIKDIQDELHMMTKVYSEQQTVVQDFSAHIQQLGGRSKEVTQKTKNKASHLVKEISRRKAEIAELTRAAERTADGVSLSLLLPLYSMSESDWRNIKLKELLDLKQKHANVSEARAGVLEAKQALIRAKEANDILTATMRLSEESKEQTKQGVKQAEATSKQNRSLMIFTIVTIIFVSSGVEGGRRGMIADWVW